MTLKKTNYNPQELAHLPLGQAVTYNTQHDPSLLQVVPRALNRAKIELQDSLPFEGEDIWTGFELSWLNFKGKPQVAIAEFRFSCTTACIIESKSFKLYLNSLNQTRFASIEAVHTTLVHDLSTCTDSQVQVDLITPDRFAHQHIIELQGTTIDDLDIEIHDYQFNPELLIHPDSTSAPVSETLISHLLKSNCLITQQPDWATIQIRYTGQPIDHEKLLRYLISFREHNEFHEQCVERIFMDLMRYCKCKQLTVYARYTRRGGLDINPFRSNFEPMPPRHRLARQ
tara:strand:- start:22113 stop:22967 length:855 start_codon:yes stop_codon:yes gene_type:complete